MKRNPLQGSPAIEKIKEKYLIGEELTSEEQKLLDEWSGGLATDEQVAEIHKVISSPEGELRNVEYQRHERKRKERSRLIIWLIVNAILTAGIVWLLYRFIIKH